VAKHHAVVARAIYLYDTENEVRTEQEKRYAKLAQLQQGIHACNFTKAEPEPISRIVGVFNENTPPRAAAPIPEAGMLKTAFTSAFASCPQSVHSNCNGDPVPVVEHSLDLGPPCTRNGAVQPGFSFDVGAAGFSTAPVALAVIP